MICRGTGWIWTEFHLEESSIRRAASVFHFLAVIMDSWSPTLYQSQVKLDFPSRFAEKFQSKKHFKILPFQSLIIGESLPLRENKDLKTKLFVIPAFLILLGCPSKPIPPNPPKPTSVPTAAKTSCLGIDNSGIRSCETRKPSRRSCC